MVLFSHPHSGIADMCAGIIVSNYDGHLKWKYSDHFLGPSFLIIWRTIISAKLKQNLIKYLNDNYHLPVLFEVYLTVSFHFPVKERRRSSDTIKLWWQGKGSRRFFLSSLRGAWFYQIGWFLEKFQIRLDLDFTTWFYSNLLKFHLISLQAWLGSWRDVEPDTAKL